LAGRARHQKMPLQATKICGRAVGKTSILHTNMLEDVHLLVCHCPADCLIYRCFWWIFSRFHLSHKGFCEVCPWNNTVRVCLEMLYTPESIPWLLIIPLEITYLNNMNGCFDGSQLRFPIQPAKARTLEVIFKAMCFHNLHRVSETTLW
jgi:hypothetical protein